MLLAIKDKTKGALGYFVVGLITVPFMLWGIQSYLGDEAPLIAASVDGSEISTQEFNQVLSRIRQNYASQYKGKLPFDEVTMRKQVVEGLINQRLMENFGNSNGFRISDSVLFSSIQNNKDFQLDGVFDRDYYQSILSANGKSATQFERALRDELQVKQYQYSIAKSSFATNQEAAKYSSIDLQTREFSYIVLNKNNTTKVAAVTKQEINDYYKQNPSQFLSTEKVKIEYVEIESKNLTTDFEVNEEKINEQYADYLAELEKDEERKARHILLTFTDEDKTTVKAELEAIKTQLSEGASFEKLAIEHSKDPGSVKDGGDLDWIAHDAMVKSFETALFSLEKGEVSEIVETQFGFHLIKLEDIRGATAISLADKRVEFISAMKDEANEGKFYDVVENLAALAYENPDSLDVVTGVLNLKVQSTDFITRQKGVGIASNAKVREAAFSSEVLGSGVNSDVIEITPNHVVILRVSEHVAADIKPLEKVEAKISSLLAISKSKNVISDKANAIKSKIDSGALISSLASKKLNVIKTGPIKRTDTSKVNLNILERGFEMLPSMDDNKSVKVVDLQTGGMAVVVLENVNSPETVDNTLIASSKRTVVNSYSKSEMDSIISLINSKADIYINNKILEQ